MTNFADIIQECESASGAGKKKVIQEALKKADLDAIKLIQAALDPYAVYGIRKYPDPEWSSTDGSIDTVFELLERLKSREFTGKNAQLAVFNVLSDFTKKTGTYLTRIFDKDLRAGFSAETFNKVHPDHTIPLFDVMLAQKCEDAEDFEKNVTWPCLAEAKLDGERTIAIVTADEVRYYSRSGKLAEHVNGLFDDELKKIHAFIGYDFVLDGERFAGSFTETVNAKKGDNDSAKANMKFYAYFLMSLSDWLNQSTNVTMEDAAKTIHHVVNTLQLSKITFPIYKDVANYEEMTEWCREVIDDHGFEGLILKNKTSTYIWDRDYAWTKCKRFYDVDVRITGFYNGRKKSRLENTLGGLTYVGFLEDGRRVEGNVGSGFSDADRNEIFQNFHKYEGATAVLKYQEVTKSASKDVASLRFVTFEHFRDDKVVEID
jgi:DNA ligase-1